MIPRMNGRWTDPFSTRVFDPERLASDSDDFDIGGFKLAGGPRAPNGHPCPMGIPIRQRGVSLCLTGLSNRVLLESGPRQGGVVSGRSTELFRTCDVARLLGVTRRQLHYWARTGLVRPTQRTKGGHHRYTRRDFVALEATKRLIDAGVSVQRIRRSAETLKQMLPAVKQPLAELELVASGDVLLAMRGAVAVLPPTTTSTAS